MIFNKSLTEDAGARGTVGRTSAAPTRRGCGYRGLESFSQIIVIHLSLFDNTAPFMSHLENPSCASSYEEVTYPLVGQKEWIPKALWRII
jgi:hypothetical protein